MNYLITTRSRSDELYTMASSFWSPEIPRKRFTGYNNYTDALKYLINVLNAPYDYIINIDEDCFVYNFGAIDRWVDVMARYGVTHLGMPDLV